MLWWALPVIVTVMPCTKEAWDDTVSANKTGYYNTTTTCTHAPFVNEYHVRTIGDSRNDVEESFQYFLVRADEEPTFAVVGDDQETRKIGVVATGSAATPRVPWQKGHSSDCEVHTAIPKATIFAMTGPPVEPDPRGRG